MFDMVKKKAYLQVYKDTNNEYRSYKINTDKRTKDTYNAIYGTHSTFIYDNKKKLSNKYINETDEKDISEFVENRVKLFDNIHEKAKEKGIKETQYAKNLEKLRDENKAYLKYDINKIRNKEYN